LNPSPPVRHPTQAAQESGPYGGQGKAARRGGAPAALLFGGDWKGIRRANAPPRLDSLHYQVGTHQSDGTFHSLCQRSKRRTTTTLRSIQAKRIFSVTLIVRYCQNQNVTSTARIRAKSAKALGLKMAARSSEVGCDSPQRWHRMAPGCTVAAQCRQVSLTKKESPSEAI
jgi:hypothetical protein